MTETPAPGADAAPPPAPRHPNVAPFNSAKFDAMAVAGMWLGVLGAGLCVIAGMSNRVIATQGFDEIRLEAAAFYGVGIVFGVLLVLAAVLRQAWVRFAGIGLLAMSAFAYALMAGMPRTDERFSEFVEIDAGRAGALLIFAFLAAMAGLALALVGAPRIGRDVPAPTAGVTVMRQSGYAVTSLVLSLCGLVAGVTAPLGIAFAVAALDDIKRGHGQTTGRGMAIAGLVVGIVLTAFFALALLAIATTADPSFNDA